MLRGEKVILRARDEADVPILHRELYGDVHEFSRSDGRAWRPIPEGEHSPYVVKEPQERNAVFSVVDAESGDLAGDAVLWRIDLHNRNAHIGLALVPAARGRGLGVDTVRVLTRYAFETLGLYRIQIETLADNPAMIATARAVGYRQEGVLRRAGWANGEFVDEVLLGLLKDDA